MSEKLYVVTPIFNPRNFRRRIQLYKEFEKYLACEEDVVLITVEVAFGDREFECADANNPYHLRLRSDDELWHKERAINLGIQHLLKIEPNAKKIAWIDADVRFTNVHWVRDTLKALEHYDVIQLFSYTMGLRPDYVNLGGIGGGVFYNFCNKIFPKPEDRRGTYGEGIALGHPGLAWAATAEALHKLGGLMDFCIMGCYDDQTEVYTQRGFIPFDDLTMEDKVLSLSSNENVEWGDVTQLHKYVYEGNMYKIKSESLDLLITPNHNMLYRKIKARNLYFEKIEDTNAARQIPKFGKWAAEMPFDFNKFGARSIEDFVAFLGIWLAEGWTYAATDGRHYRIGIAQNKNENWTKIRDLLENGFPGIKWNHSTKRGELCGFIGNNKSLFDYLRKLGKCSEKYIPDEIKKLPTEYLKTLLDWYVLGDGNIEKKKNILHADTTRMYTSSVRLRDDLIECIIKTGSWASISQTIGKLSQPLADGRRIQANKERPFYIITIQKSGNFYVKPRAISKKEYKGFVYCCETPNHTLLVKRGNRIVWCGNSGDSHMANSLMGDVRSYYNTRLPSEGLSKAFAKWQEKANLLKKNIGYVDGICIHYWHGKMNLRGYEEKWEMICNHAYDPYEDIYPGLNGLYQWAGNKKGLEHDLRHSAMQRNEDSIDWR